MRHEIESIQHDTDFTLAQIQRQREALARREEQLLSYVEQRNIDIPVAIGQALLESVNALLAPSKQDIDGNGNHLPCDRQR